MAAFTKDTPGTEVFAAVLKKNKGFSKDGASICDGLIEWKAFLDKKQYATIGECLDNFEKKMDGGIGNKRWPWLLFAGTKDSAYPEFLSSVVSRMTAEDSDRVLRHHANRISIDDAKAIASKYKDRLSTRTKESLQK